MKHLLMTCLLVVLAGCTKAGDDEQPMPGGWSKIPVTSESAIAAAQFAIKTESELLGSKEKPADLKLVEIVRAKSQVVAGANYELTLKVKLDGAEKTALTRIWSKLDKTYELTFWRWPNADDAALKP